MTKKATRCVAVRAACSYLKEQGVFNATVDDAYRALDDLARIDAETLAAIWWRQATRSQLAIFKTEWRAARRWQGDRAYFSE